VKLVRRAARIFHEECDRKRAVELLLANAPLIDRRFDRLEFTPDRSDLSRKRLKSHAAAAAAVTLGAGFSDEDRSSHAEETAALKKFAGEATLRGRKDLRQRTDLRHLSLGAGVTYVQLARLTPDVLSRKPKRQHRERPSASIERVCAHLSTSVGAFGDDNIEQAADRFAKAIRPPRRKQDT
jgi:hypothetical protein